jgi:hypothetical protein
LLHCARYPCSQCINLLHIRLRAPTRKAQCVDTLDEVELAAHRQRNEYQVETILHCLMVLAFTAASMVLVIVVGLGLLLLPDLLPLIFLLAWALLA